MQKLFKSVLIAGALTVAVAALCAPAGPTIAQAPAGEPAVDAQADEPEETTELLGSRALFNVVHGLGIVGGIGLTGVLAIGLAIRWANLPPHRRRRLASAHMALAVPFGILAMTHGTILFFHEILEGDLGFGGALGIGSWLCTFTLLMVVSGLGRRYDRGRIKMWIQRHKLVLWPWVVAAVWHLLAELF